MGYIEAADGTLTITDDASNPADDLQKIADLAAKLGGLLRGTSVVRQSLTASQTRVGWLFVETDTNIIFERRADGWSRATRATVGFRHVGRTSGDGTLSIPNPFAPSIPKWMQVSQHNSGQEELDKLLVPMVWTSPLVGTNNLARIRRLDTNNWMGVADVAVFATFGLH